jgi:hypothetical protein
MTTKRRITTPPNANVHGPEVPPVQVVDERPGAVTFLDKLKGYYKALITVVGAVLLALNELTPLTDFLPMTAQHWLSVAVAVGTAILTALKANEHWVDDS